MGWLITASILLLILVIYSACSSEDDGVLPFVIILIGAFIFVAFLRFSASDNVADKILKGYEEGKYQKEYTIIGSDTTYKWVSKSIEE